MSKRTEIIIESKLSLFEHRFISGEPEHRVFEVTGEHRAFGAIAEHRTMDMMAEHRTLEIASERDLALELDPLVLGQSTLKLSNPHKVSSVTVKRRSDGSFFLVIEE